MNVILMILGLLFLGTIIHVFKNNAWEDKDSKEKKGGYILLFILSLICFHFSNLIPVAIILFLLSPFIFLGLIIGLIKPSWVIRWGKKKNRKQVFKYYGIGLVLTFFIAIFLAPAPSVTNRVKNARNYIEENNYKQAIASYKSSLNDWNKEKDYPFNKKDIESEFKTAKKEFSKKIINKAEKEFSKGNISNAEDKLNEAKKYWNKSSDFLLLQAKIKEKKKEKQINQLLDEALEESESGNYEKAVQKIADANQLGYIPRINKVKDQLSSQMQSIINNHLNKINTALEKWNLEKAKKHVKTIINLKPNDPKVRSAKNKLEDKKKIVKKIGEKPKNSEWDASVRPVKQYLRKHLKDPGSVKYIEWSPVHLTRVNGSPFWRVRVKYRAKNSFGGYVIEEKLAYIMNGQVVAMENFQ